LLVIFAISCADEAIRMIAVSIFPEPVRGVKCRLAFDLMQSRYGSSMRWS